MKEQDKGRSSPARFHEKSHTRAQPKPKERSEPVRNPVFDLQRTAGNQAVVNLFESGAIQAKLRVSQPQDADEVEADRVADQVVRPGTASAVASPASGTIHRKCDCPGGVASCPACEEEEVEQAKGIHRKSSEPSHEELSVRDDFLQALGPGQPLGAETREFMESRFGEDFGRVRVHTDERAANSARSLRAKAYTFNSDIVFDSGAYEPSTPTGKKLLAHELSHVTQQRGGSTTATAPASHPKVQRQFGEIVSVLTGVPEPIVDIAISPYRQFAGDLVASVKEAPDHAAEILVGEVWDAIKEHWLSFILTTAGLIGAEIAVGILTAVPEPTLITKAIALILQLLIIAIIGYFAAVELVGVYEEGRNWFSLAKSANGNPKIITEASKAFLRMVRHIIFAILALIGVRAKVAGLRIPGAAAAADVRIVPVSERVPPAEARPPTLETKPPLAETKPPVGETKPSVAEAKTPAAESKPASPKPEVPKPGEQAAKPSAETKQPDATATKKPPSKEPAPGKRARSAASKQGIELRKKIAYDRMKAGQYDPLQDVLTSDERQAFLDSNGKALPKDIDWHHTRQTSADPGMADVPEHIQPVRHLEHIYGEHLGKPANTPTAGIRGDVTSPSKPIYDPNAPEVQTGRYNPHEPVAEGTVEEQGLSERDLPSRKPGSFRDLPRVKDPALKGNFDYELRTEEGVYRREIATGKWVKFRN